MEHLPIVPVVLPLAAGALMLLLDERRHALKAGIGTGPPKQSATRTTSRSYTQRSKIYKISTTKSVK